MHWRMAAEQMVAERTATGRISQSRTERERTEDGRTEGVVDDQPTCSGCVARTDKISKQVCWLLMLHA